MPQIRAPFSGCMVTWLLLCLAITPLAHAKKLYKFKDAEGQWHFSDAKPEQGQAQNLEVKQVKVDPALAVVLESHDESGRRLVLASNHLVGPVEVEVTPQELINMSVNPTLPHRFLLPASSLSLPIIEMRLENPQLTGTIRYGYSYTPGDPSANPQSDYPYLPPFPTGGTYLISQGFFGSYSHQNEENRYAVDITMPERTPVHAVRGGVIMSAENDFFESGVKEKLQSRANNIRILHDDGGMAVYAHLAVESALVYPGQNVVAGQHIGYSGSTGYASGPHLHLVIQRNAGMKLVAIPFRFLAPDGSLLEPKQGDILQGVAAVQK